MPHERDLENYMQDYLLALETIRMLVREIGIDQVETFVADVKRENEEMRQLALEEEDNIPDIGPKP